MSLPEPPLGEGTQRCRGVKVHESAKRSHEAMVADEVCSSPALYCEKGEVVAMHETRAEVLLLDGAEHVWARALVVCWPEQVVDLKVAVKTGLLLPLHVKRCDREAL